MPDIVSITEIFAQVVTECRERTTLPVIVLTWLLTGVGKPLDEAYAISMESMNGVVDGIYAVLNSRGADGVSFPLTTPGTIVAACSYCFHGELVVAIETRSGPIIVSQ